MTDRKLLHDLANKIGSIQMNAEFLVEDNRDDEGVVEVAKDILKAANDASAIIEGARGNV